MVPSPQSPNQQGTASPVRTLLFSTLYPSSARPLHGIFVETRLRELLARTSVQSQVLAPVPWFPFAGGRFGKYAAMAATPARETHNGVQVRHPRYLVIPKVGMGITPFFLAWSARRTLRQMQREGFDFDVIDAHYYYPDGVAAALLGRWFNKPVTITARGTDLNVIPNDWWPRKLIKWAATQAQASIGVSAALVEVLKRLAIDGRKLHVFRNGIDLERFRPLPQAECRAQLGVDGAPLMVCVGNVHPHKGQDVAIDALAALLPSHPQARLALVGDGPHRQALQAQAQRLGVAERVHFAGAVPNAQLLHWFSAADLSLLCSSREGWPNVLLESMACGAPAIASRVGGTPEVIQDSQAGTLVEERSGAAFAKAVAQLWQAGIDRAAVRRYAEGFSWEKTSQDQADLFSRLAGRTTAAGAAAKAVPA